jgi:hypothetical protein
MIVVMKHPKRWLGVVCLLACLGLVRLETAEAVPHSFSSGDLISADMFNELFSAVEPDLVTTIVGTWSTQCWDSGTDSDIDSPGTGTLTVAALTNVAFESSEAYDSCIYGDSAESQTDHAFTRFKVIGNKAIIALKTTAEFGEIANVYKVLELTDNSLLLLLGSSVLIQLTRAITPPAIPTALAATVTDTTIALSWTDNSSDETGFIITRKDSLTGSYATIATTSSDGTNYTDTGTAGASYWYRVEATSGNGTSLGSNEVKVTLE